MSEPVSRCVPPHLLRTVLQRILPQSIRPNQLWRRLSDRQRQELCQALSELVARRMSPQMEVTHEPR